ncbi:MAG: M28 family peptidase, partial [Clostridiales bacterium]|nr:M28 family peptidase [Clostridiales bacterium]
MEGLFDTESCLSYLQSIWENDRWFCFSSFQKTAMNCARFFSEAGLAQVEELRLEADGKTLYGDWAVPKAWDAQSATLAIEGGMVLADYERTPCSLAMYSAPTPEGGASAKAVLADDPGAPADGLAGKILFTSRPAAEMLPLAARCGAAGIVSDFMPLWPGVRASRKAAYGASRWDNSFAVPANTSGMWAFSISPMNGDILRGMLASGESVTLNAQVRARQYDGTVSVVSACLEGREPGAEALICGHLYEPGANDNASGCAAILELARCMAYGVRTGALARPRHAIRFALVYECAGSTAYALAYPERMARTIAAIVTDMIGADVTENTLTYVWRDPLSNFSFADALIGDICAAYGQCAGGAPPMAEKAFSVGTDNILGDPIWGVPTVALVAEPALSYHSSLDTPERIEPGALSRNAVIAGTYLLRLANAGAGEAEALRRGAMARMDALVPARSGFPASFLREEMSRIILRSAGRFCSLAGAAGAGGNVGGAGLGGNAGGTDSSGNASAGGTDSSGNAS